MSKDTCVGWCAMFGTVVISAMYVVSRLQAGESNIIYLYLLSLICFVIPGYLAFLIYLCVRRHRFPPIRFLAGIAIFFATVAGYLVWIQVASNRGPFYRDMLLLLLIGFVF